MGFLTIDIGSSNIKCALVDNAGNLLFIQKAENDICKSQKGYTYYDPENMWQTAKGLIAAVAKDADCAIEGIAITGMSESGLLLERQTLAPLSRIIPWHDAASSALVPEILRVKNEEEFFYQTGVHINPRGGLCKILWLRTVYPDLPNDAYWLSVPDYICFKLTGQRGTDPTLAARTFGYDIRKKAYDDDFLRHFHLTADCFAPVHHCTSAVGNLTQSVASEVGLACIPVAIAGHDHICTTMAVSANEPGYILDSMGTAESLVGLRKEAPLTKEDFDRGIHYGIYPIDGIQFCIGGLSTSGGSVEWLRSLNPFYKLSYADIDTLDAEVSTSPGDVLFFPYLAGRAAPVSDPDCRASILRLGRGHTLADLYKAISEGVSMDIKTMLLAFGIEPQKIVAVGGGTNNKNWMQMKANIMNEPIFVPKEKECALRGAAVAASVMCGHYSDLRTAMQAFSMPYDVVYTPDKQAASAYDEWYNKAFCQMRDTIYST